MNRLVYFLFSLPLFLSFITSADAGPACARRNEGSDACIAKCKDKWGWPGHAMGTDRWGQVLTKTLTNDMGAVVTQACRVKPSGLGTGAAKASTTSISSSTSPLLVPPSSVAPANVIVSASASTEAVSAAPSVTLLSLARPNTTSHSSKAFTAFVASSTAPASKFTTIKLTTSSSSSSPSPTSTKPSTTHTTTSHTEAPPPPPETTTTKTSSKQPSATANASSGDSQSGGSNNNNGNNGSSDNNNNGNSSNSGSSSSGSTSQSDIDQYLQAHNSIRSQHGASPLTWSDDLAAKAQQWANNCVFQHSGGSLGPFGENLAAGTGSSYGIQSAVKSWTDEVSEYDPNNPEPSHFTQVVWKASSQVGCAVQSCNGIFDASFGPAKFYVCEYSKQGNVIGQFAQNVQV